MVEEPQPTMSDIIFAVSRFVHAHVPCPSILQVSREPLDGQCAESGRGD